MTLEFIVRPEAEAEIKEAFDWYEERLSGLGHDFILNLDAAFNTIIRNPLLYPALYKNIRRMLLRRFPYHSMFKFLIGGEVVAESGNTLGFQLCQNRHRNIVRPATTLHF